MPKTLLIFSLICFWLTESATAQLIPGKVVLARGTIINDSSAQAIPYVHIFNESKRIGTLSNIDGEFKFRAEIGDTVVLTSIGYLGKVIYVDKTMLENGATIRLEPRMYTIDAVDITGYGSYAKFKKKFLALDLSDDEVINLRNNLASLSQQEAVLGASEEEARKARLGQPGTEPFNGIPILYKEDLQRLNYQRILKLEAKQRIADEKYNREIVKRVTNLPDEEITDFMVFCSFSLDYLCETSAYDILVRIEQKFKEYLEKKSAGEVIKPEEWEGLPVT